MDGDEGVAAEDDMSQQQSTGEAVDGQTNHDAMEVEESMAGVEGAGLCGGGGEVPGDGAAEAPGAGEGVAPGHLDEEPGSPDLGEPPARLVNGGDDAGRVGDSSADEADMVSDSAPEDENVPPSLIALPRREGRRAGAEERAAPREEQRDPAAGNGAQLREEEEDPETGDADESVEETRNTDGESSPKRVVRVMPVGGADKDKEVAAETEDEDVTADIMDVTKSITQQILDSSVQDKPEDGTARAALGPSEPNLDDTPNSPLMAMPEEDPAPPRPSDAAARTVTAGSDETPRPAADQEQELPLQSHVLSDHRREKHTYTATEVPLVQSEAKTETRRRSGGKKKCLYCEVEEDGEETSLVDVSEETVTVGDKEMDILTVVKKLLLPKSFVSKVTASGEAQHVAPPGDGVHMCEECVNYVTELTETHNNMKKPKQGFLDRCKEDTYVDRLRNDVDMNHDLTNAESICSNCNFGKSGAELAMYDFKKNIDDGRVTVLRAVEAIVGVRTYQAVVQGRFLCAGCYKWVKQYANHYTSVKTTVTSLVTRYRRHCASRVLTPESQLTGQSARASRMSPVVQLQKVSAEVHTPSPTPRARGRAAQRRASTSGDEADGSSADDEYRSEHPGRRGKAASSAKKKAQPKIVGPQCANCATKGSDVAQKFNFRRKEGTKTLLEILYTAFAPNTLQQSECATKFLCQDCHEALLDFTNAKARLKEVRENLTRRLSSSAYVGLVKNSKTTEALDWLKDKAEANCVVCSNKLIAGKTHPMTEGIDTGVDTWSTQDMLIMMMETNLDDTGNTCGSCMNHIRSYALAHETWSDNVRCFFQGRRKTASFLGFKTKEKPAAVRELDDAKVAVRTIKARAASKRAAEERSQLRQAQEERERRREERERRREDDSDAEKRDDAAKRGDDAARKRDASESDANKREDAEPGKQDRLDADKKAIQRAVESSKPTLVVVGGKTPVLKLHRVSISQVVARSRRTAASDSDDDNDVEELPVPVDRDDPDWGGSDTGSMDGGAAAALVRPRREKKPPRGYAWEPIVDEPRRDLVTRTPREAAGFSLRSLPPRRKYSLHQRVDEDSDSDPQVLDSDRDFRPHRRSRGTELSLTLAQGGGDKNVEVRTKAISFLRSNNVRDAMRCLYNDPGSRDEIISFLSRRVNNEVRTFNFEVSKGVKTSCLTDTVTASSISTFRWSQVLEELGDGIPCLYRVLMGAVATKTFDSFDDAEPRKLHGGQHRCSVPFANLLATIMYIRNPPVFKFVQQCNGLQLHRNRKTAITSLNRLGVSVGWDMSVKLEQMLYGDEGAENEDDEIDARKRALPKQVKNVLGTGPGRRPTFQYSGFRNQPEGPDPREEADVGIWPEPIYKGQSGVSVNTFNPVKSVTGRYENVHSAWDVISNEPYVPPPAPAYAGRGRPSFATRGRGGSRATPKGTRTYQHTSILRKKAATPTTPAAARAASTPHEAEPAPGAGDDPEWNPSGSSTPVSAMAGRRPRGRPAKVGWKDQVENKERDQEYKLAEEGTMSTIDPMTSNELFSFSTDTSVSRSPRKTVDTSSSMQDGSSSGKKVGGAKFKFIRDLNSGQTVAVPVGEDEDDRDAFDAGKYHEEQRGRKRGRESTGAASAAKAMRYSQAETEAATRTLVGLSDPSPSLEETSTPAAAPVTTSSSVMSQQNIATVGQIVMPGETPAKTVSSTQEGGKRKMTFVVPKGHQLVVRKLPNGKSEFVTVPKANMTDTVVTPVKSSTSGGRGALTNPLSPTALIEGETYGDMADTEHAAQMLMGISGQSVPSTVSQQSDTQFVVGEQPPGSLPQAHLQGVNAAGQQQYLLLVDDPNNPGQQQQLMVSYTPDKPGGQLDIQQIMDALASGGLQT